MADKSPHAPHSAKRSGKARKAKKAAHRAQQDTASQVQRLVHPRKGT